MFRKNFRELLQERLAVCDKIPVTVMLKTALI